MRRRPSQPVPARRRGTIMPLIAFAILAVCAAGALVLDRLWIDAAQVQLNAAAEASALAAAGRLADDDRLRQPYDAAASVERALRTADDIARMNYVAGRPVELDLSDEGDVRFGQIVEDSNGNQTFLETKADPTSVFVVAQSLRKRGNPILVFFRGVTGNAAADAQGGAEATIDNRVIGVRSFPGASVPCLPLGILETDPTGTQENTWEKQIELREGEDRYGYDIDGGAVFEGADGIPEITLTVDQDGDDMDQTNVTMLDLGSRFLDHIVKQQITDGLTEEDLQYFDNEILLDLASLPVDGQTDLINECAAELKSMIGTSRLCLLYQDESKGNDLEVGRLNATRFVAIRILKIDQSEEGPIQIIVQPSVVATRTAVLSDDRNAYENPYVYKLYLTH